MHILTIYCDKKMVTAAIFTAEAAPQCELVVRLVVDEKTQAMSAKVYDKEQFRQAACGMSAVPLEKERVPAAGRAGAVDWLVAWLARMGFQVEHTIIANHMHGREFREAVGAKIKGSSISGVRRPEALAEWAWHVVESARRHRADLPRLAA